ncbi:MAG: hypothetical protein R8M11_02245 [Gallionella sp.]
MNKPSIVILGIFTFSMLYPSLAHAYVDPGSGSVIITTILGLIAAVGYTIRKYFYRIRSFFKKSTNDKDDSENE